MSGILKRFVSASVGVLVCFVLLMPLTAEAASSKPSLASSTKLAKMLATAPRGVTHWTFIQRPMVETRLTISGGRLGTALPYNTVYGNCGSSWMAIGALGGGHVWVALGWDIYYSAYWEAWATTVYAPVGPRGNGGSGPVAPWHSTSWDTGYNLFSGWGWVLGYGYMAAYLYRGGACTSNLPSGWAYAY
jgi:hypothetical protein